MAALAKSASPKSAGSSSMARLEVSIVAAQLVAVADDLVEVDGLVAGERAQAEVVDDEQARGR